MLEHYLSDSRTTAEPLSWCRWLTGLLSSPRAVSTCVMVYVVNWLAFSPTLQDEIILSYAGSNRTAQITDIRTYRGGQTYIFILLVRF